MLLALRLLLATSAPMRDALTLHEVLAAMAGDPVLAILAAALLTWFAHSSLAMVLLIMSLAAAGIVQPGAACFLVLGANLGGAIPAMLASLSEGPAARRVTLGNAAFRVLGVIAVAPFVAAIVPWIAALESDAARQVVDFHMVFNLAIAGVFLPLTGAAAALLERVVPAGAALADDPGRARYLDRSSIDLPERRADLRRARDAAHGRHRRDHAAPEHDRAGDGRPQARRRDRAHGQFR